MRDDDLDDDLLDDVIANNPDLTATQTLIDGIAAGRRASASTPKNKLEVTSKSQEALEAPQEAAQEVAKKQPKKSKNKPLLHATPDDAQMLDEALGLMELDHQILAALDRLGPCRLRRLVDEFGQPSAVVSRRLTLLVTTKCVVQEGLVYSAVPEPKSEPAASASQAPPTTTPAPAPKAVDPIPSEPAASASQAPPTTTPERVQIVDDWGRVAPLLTCVPDGVRVDLSCPPPAPETGAPSPSRTRVLSPSAPKLSPSAPKLSPSAPKISPRPAPQFLPGIPPLPSPSDAARAVVFAHLGPPPTPEARVPLTRATTPAPPPASSPKQVAQEFRAALDALDCRTPEEAPEAWAEVERTQAALGEVAEAMGMRVVKGRDVDGEFVLSPSPPTYKVCRSKGRRGLGIECGVTAHSGAEVTRLFGWRVASHVEDTRRPQGQCRACRAWLTREARRRAALERAEPGEAQLPLPAPAVTVVAPLLSPEARGVVEVLATRIAQDLGAEEVRATVVERAAPLTQARPWWIVQHDEGDVGPWPRYPRTALEAMALLDRVFEVDLGGGAGLVGAHLVMARVAGQLRIALPKGLIRAVCVEGEWSVVEGSLLRDGAQRLDAHGQGCWARACAALVAGLGVDEEELGLGDGGNQNLPLRVQRYAAQIRADLGLEEG